MAQQVSVTWVALECRRRQEGSDEVYGSVNAIPGDGKQVVQHKFPGDRPYWNMGKSPGGRIVTVAVPLYSGPPKPLALAVTLVEHDSGNIDKYKEMVAQQVAKGAGAVASAYTGGAAAIAQPLIDDLARGLVNAATGVLGTADDQYNPGTLNLDAQTLTNPNRPRHMLRRGDDPRTANYTDVISITGVDEGITGGDLGEYAFYFDIRVSGQPEKVQREWRHCTKCRSLFWDGWPVKGKCPAGGSHERGNSLHYSLVYDAPPSPDMQAGWRHCAKCTALFWAGRNGSSNRGRCPAGGAHDRGNSVHFSLVHGASAPHGTQGGWRHCRKCGLLFWDGSSNKGRCAADGAHDRGSSWHFSLRRD